MGECSALATKQELENVRRQLINLEQEIDDKIDENNKPEIIQTAAGLGSASALALLDPKVRQALAKVASLTSQVGDLFAKYANVISIISTLASVAALTVLQFQVERLRGRTAVLETLVGGLEIENKNLRKAVDAANKKVQAVTELAYRATTDANTAIVNAQKAITKADLAIIRSNRAIYQADINSAKADQAISDANLATDKADQARSEANLATDKANQIIQNTNDNAKTVTSLKSENAALKQKTDSLVLELITQKKALEEANKKIEDYKTGVEPVVKEYVTRKVRESKITTYGDITTLKTSSKQLESSIEQRDREVNNNVRKLKERVEFLRETAFNPDIPNNYEKRILTGAGGLDSSQVKEIVNTEIDSRLGDVTTVNDQQYQNVLDQLENIPALTNTAVQNAILPALKPIADNAQLTVAQTSAPVIVQAATQGVCNSTRPGGCMQRNVVDRLTGNVGNLINAGGTAFSAANNALLLRMNGTLNNVKNTVTTIKNTTNTTLGVVQHAKYGLEASFKFAQTAWKATRIGKVLEYLSLAATIHNAAMLSRNVGGSLGDTISAIANNTISLIKNEEFQGININETLGTSIEGFLKNLIGAENYTGVSETLSKYNRIINSASNVIYSITSIQAGLAQGLETIGNYTGRIGNALKKSGQVLESSYGWMSEKTSVKTGRLGQIQRVIDTGEGIENVASDIQNATQEFREAQENVNNIGRQYKKVKTEFTEQEIEKTTLETTVKTNSQGAQPELTDFVKDPIQK